VARIDSLLQEMLLGGEFFIESYQKFVSWIHLLFFMFWSFFLLFLDIIWVFISIYF
jgi:hypothetical protein